MTLILRRNSVRGWSSMRIISFTKKGCVINERLCKKFGAEGFTTYEYNGLKKISVSNFTEKGFEKRENMIFVGATGIAVRSISRFLKDKFTDPAVLVIDEEGKFVIPILSGHVGGANNLAVSVSEFLDAEAVITTATDINKVFAVDIFAKENSLEIHDRGLAKKISAYLLDKKDVSFKCDYGTTGNIPLFSDGTELGIYVSTRNENCFKETLHLIPKKLILGIGCKKGTEKKKIEEAVNWVFDENSLFKSAIRLVATIDIKKDEKGLIDFCNEIGKELVCYSSDSLKIVQGEFTSSEFVKGVTGVDNVCERAAVLASEDGSIIVRKTSKDGVTVAVAEEKWSVNFE